MTEQKIVFNSTFTLFCTGCGAVINSNLIPNEYGSNFVAFLLSNKKCPNCGNDSEFNIARSEIKRLLII